MQLIMFWSSPASSYALRNAIPPHASVVKEKAIGKWNLTWSPAFENDISLNLLQDYVEYVCTQDQ